MATRTLKVKYDGGTVTAKLAGHPGEVGIVLAHGAGAGQSHPWMQLMRSLLAERYATLSFNYRYTEAGRSAPDRLATLLEVHRAAADRMTHYVDAVVLAGKSLGGRMGSHLAAGNGAEGWPTAGLVYYGYPLVPMGKSEPRDTAHLRTIRAPQLFFAGTSDRLGPPVLLEPIAQGLPNGSLVVVDEGDHSFKVPKRTGRTQEDELHWIATETCLWIDRDVGVKQA